MTTHPAMAGGQRVGQFELLDELGRGGMGVVFRARELHSGRLVALKVVLGDAQSPNRLARFEREGSVTAALDHPGIVKVHAAGQHNGLPFLAYQLVDGARSWDEVVFGLPLNERVRLVRDVSRALGAAHAQGIVHRDVKPDNVLIDREGRVRVADFGLATAQDLERLTQTGTMLGTPHFMAPEQFSGSSRTAVGPPADVWSLGVLLHYTVAQSLPFSAGSLFELAAVVARKPPPRLRTLNQEVSPGLEAVCLRALSQDPARRYPTGAELADDLERVLRGEAVATRAWEGVARGWARRSAWVAAPLAAGLLLAAALAYEPARAPVAATPPAVSRPATSAPHEPAGPSPGQARPEQEQPPPSSDRETTPLAAMNAGIADALDATLSKAQPKDVAFLEINKGRILSRTNPSQANVHLKRSADLGNAEGARLYAERLAKGIGGPVDKVGARRYFRLGAEGDDPTAMYSFGSMLVRGVGGPRQPKEGCRWLLRASEAGQGNAMRELSEELRRGVHLERDLERADYWAARYRALKGEE